jgi:hypothetical protein
MPVEVAAGRLSFLGAKTRTQATAPGIRGMRGTSEPQPGPDERCLRLLRNAHVVSFAGCFAVSMAVCVRCQEFPSDDWRVAAGLGWIWAWVLTAGLAAGRGILRGKRSGRNWQRL